MYDPRHRARLVDRRCGVRGYSSLHRDEDQLYIFRLREHLERLERSMRLVRFKLEYDLDELTDAIIDPSGK